MTQADLTALSSSEAKAAASQRWDAIDVARGLAIVAMIVLRRSGLGRKQKRDTSTNPDVNLDIGATVTVDAWRDGRARVQYRGADWDVELENGERDDAHVYQVSAVRGNCLVVVAKPAG